MRSETTTDITDVLADGLNFSDGAGRVYAPRQVAKLAAATASGPLVEDVECPKHTGHWLDVDGPCDCGGSGTVRIRVTRDDPALAAELLEYADEMDGSDWYDNRVDPHRAAALRAAARIIGGEK